MYRPRATAFRGTMTTPGGWWKRYTVQQPGLAADAIAWADAFAAVHRAAPLRTVRGVPSGLGFWIGHEADPLRYLIRGAWVNANELVLHCWVQASTRSGAPWEAGGDDFAPCVWDLEIVAFERQALIDTTLTPGGGGPSAYLARGLTTTVAAAGRN